MKIHWHRTKGIDLPCRYLNSAWQINTNFSYKESYE